MMIRLLVTLLMLGAAHAAFGHDPDGDIFFFTAFDYCTDNGGTDTIHTESCEHLCDDAPTPMQDLTQCQTTWGIDPGCTDPLICGPIQTGIFDSFNNNTVDDIASDNNNIYDDDFIDIDTRDVLSGNSNIGNTDNTDNTDNSNSTHYLGDHDESTNNTGLEAGAINQTITDGNTTVTDSSQQTITDGDTSQSVGVNDNSQQTITDGDQEVNLDSNDDNRVTVDLHSHDDNTNENESESSSSTDDSGNSAVSIDQSDHRVSNVTSTYKEAYRAPNLSTQLNVTTSHCINFIGLQFSGARQNGAGALGLGWPARDEECRLEKAAMLAFQMENYEAGWTAYCNQKSVRHAWADRMKSDGHERKGRKAAASIACRQSGVDTQQTLLNIHEELGLLRNELEIIEHTEADDTAILARIRVLENAAHLPNQSFLLQHDAHHEVPHTH